MRRETQSTGRIARDAALYGRQEFNLITGEPLERQAREILRRYPDFGECALRSFRRDGLPRYTIRRLTFGRHTYFAVLTPDKSTGRDVLRKLYVILPRAVAWAEKNTSAGRGKLGIRDAAHLGRAPRKTNAALPLPWEFGRLITAPINS